MDVPRSRRDFFRTAGGLCLPALLQPDPCFCAGFTVRVPGLPSLPSNGFFARVQWIFEAADSPRARPTYFAEETVVDETRIDQVMPPKPVLPARRLAGRKIACNVIGLAISRRNLLALKARYHRQIIFDTVGYRVTLYGVQGTGLDASDLLWIEEDPDSMTYTFITPVTATGLVDSRVLQFA